MNRCPEAEKKQRRLARFSGISSLLLCGLIPALLLSQTNAGTQALPGKAEAHTLANLADGWSPSKLGGPFLRDPVWVYNNWSSYDELSDNIPLTEELAMKELGEMVRLRKLGIHFDYYMMDAFWFAPDGGYRTWRTPHWPNGGDKWIAACKENGIFPGIWLGTNALVHISAAPQWKDSVGTSGWTMSFFEGGFLPDFMDVLQYWYDRGIRMFKFDFAYFDAATAETQKKWKPEEIRERNETAFRDALAKFRANRDLQTGFQQYLKAKFHTVDEVNKVWGLNYWGQRLNDWTELPPRDGIINPGWKLEWERYSQWLTTDFLAWQASIVNEYRRSDQFVTHDFAGPPRPEVNELDVSRTLDVAAANPYHDTQDGFDGEVSSRVGDYMRSLKNTNYLVTETNAEAIGWDSKDQYPPYDGQLRLDVYTHVSSGANMVEYWHWHSIHYGQETYWKGVLGHDLEPGRAYDEVSRTAHELERIGREIADLQRKNQVAILHSNDSYYGIEFIKFSEGVNYRTIEQQMYRALYRANVGVDFVFPESTSLSSYKVILVPPLYVASDAVLRKLAEYVRGGGNLVVAFKSGFSNEYSTVRWDMAPGPLREAAGVHYQEFSSLQHPLALKDDPFHAGDDNRVTAWAEMLLPDTAKALAYYDHPFFAKYPAITQNTFGRGTLTYEGTVLSDKLQSYVLLSVLQKAGLTGPDQNLPAAVRVKHGINRKGQTLHYYLNYSSAPQTFAYEYGAGEEILLEAAVTHGQSISLKPWDVAIIEEK